MQSNGSSIASSRYREISIDRELKRNEFMIMINCKFRAHAYGQFAIAARSINRSCARGIVQMKFMNVWA